MKIDRTYMSQIGLNLNPRDLEALEFDGIWHVRP
jgi:hypothetical protein